MQREEFKVQIERLLGQWPNSYGDERQIVLWQVFKNESAEVFTDAVTYCIANNRAAPLMKELNEAIVVVKRSPNEYRSCGGVDASRGALQILERAAVTAENKEFAKACTQILRDKIEGRLTEAQFLQACDLLDETARRLTPACKHCSGEGYRLEQTQNGRFTYRCNCAAGYARPEKASGPAGKDGSREDVFIPMWRAGTIPQGRVARL